MHFQIQTLKNPSNQEITLKTQNTNLKEEILHFFNSGILKKISIQLKQQHLKQQFLSQKNENFIILIFLLILKYNYPSFFQKEILFNNQDKQEIDDLLSKTYIEIFSKIPTNSKEIVINHVIFANIKLVENDENNYSNGEEIDEELKQIQTEEEIKENLKQKFFQFTHLVIFKILGIFVSNPYIKENCNRIFNQIDKELEYKMEYEKKRIQKEEFKLIPFLDPNNIIKTISSNKNKSLELLRSKQVLFSKNSTNNNNINQNLQKSRLQKTRSKTDNHFPSISKNNQQNLTIQKSLEKQIDSLKNSQITNNSSNLYSENNFTSQNLKFSRFSRAKTVNEKQNNNSQPNFQKIKQSDKQIYDFLFEQNNFYNQNPQFFNDLKQGRRKFTLQQTTPYLSNYLEFKEQRLPFLPKKVINHPLKTSEDPENFYILLKKFLEEKQTEQTKPYEKKVTEQQKKQEEEKKLIKNDIFKYYNIQADHQQRKLLTEMKENQFQNKYFREMVEFQIVLDKTRQKFSDLKSFKQQNSHSSIQNILKYQKN